VPRECSGSEAALREAPKRMHFQWAVILFVFILVSPVFLTAMAEPLTKVRKLGDHHKLIVTYEMDAGDILKWDWKVTDGNVSMYFALEDNVTGAVLFQDIALNGSGQMKAGNTTRWSLVWLCLIKEYETLRYTLEINPVSWELVYGTVNVMVAIPFFTAILIIFRRKWL
jgi:hypothetical protein